ncbi:MAG: ubiquinol-cytochrome C chaperone family protein [Parvularcula sp.]
MVFRVLSLIPGLGRLAGSPRTSQARGLYTKLVSQARQPVFYTELGVPDTLEGRFDMIALHMFAVLRHLRADPAARDQGQALFDVMFEDMDDSFREMGVSDTKVGSKVRGLAEEFYGRIGVYESPVAAQDAAALTPLVGRNILEDEAAPGASRLAAYLLAFDKILSETSRSALMAGEIAFPALDERND